MDSEFILKLAFEMCFVTAVGENSIAHFSSKGVCHHKNGEMRREDY